jgi:hypothetical protein
MPMNQSQVCITNAETSTVVEYQRKSASCCPGSGAVRVLSIAVFATLANCSHRASRNKCNALPSNVELELPASVLTMRAARPERPQADVNPSMQRRQPRGGVRILAELAPYQKDSERGQEEGCNELDDVAAGHGHCCFATARSWGCEETGNATQIRRSKSRRKIDYRGSEQRT